jgi:hypothetical protein
LHHNLCITAAAAAAVVALAAPAAAGESPKDAAFQVIDRNTDAMAKFYLNEHPKFQ